MKGEKHMKKTRTTVVAYQYTLDATYKFLTKIHGQEVLVPNETKVKVIGESNRCYKIQLLEPIRNHRVGDQILVHKKSLQFHTPNPNHEQKSYWWDNM